MRHAYRIYELAQTISADGMTSDDLEWQQLAEDRRLERDSERLRTADERKEARATQPGYCYLILIDGQIKIGWAGDVKKRMTHYPPTSQLLAVHPGTLETERHLHNQFRAHLFRGREWFQDCDEIRAYCAQTVDQFGPPDRFAHEFRTARPVTVIRAS